MKCPQCGDLYTKVLQTIRNENGLRRTRVCAVKGCSHRFHTMERVEVYDYVIGDYVEPGPGKVVPIKEKRPARSKRFAASLDHPAMTAIDPGAQPLLVEWWNVARWSKHQGRATWTEAAWEGSLSRVAALPHWKQVRLAAAGVEHGWQALKPEYLSADPPTGAGRPMPKDPSMIAALDSWQPNH